MDVKRWAVIAYLLFASVGLGRAQSGGDSLSLSLGEALDLAEKQSLSLRSADLGIAKAKMDRRVSLANFFPTIGLNGKYDYTIKKPKVYFGSEDASSNNPMAAMMPSDGIEMGQTHNITAALGASMPLVAPQLWASLELDKVSIETAIEKLRAGQITLRSEVRKAYMGALLAEESYRVLLASLENMIQNRDNIAEKYKRGLVAEYELIRMNVQVQNLQPNLIQAEQQARLAKMKLLVLMNMEPTTHLRLSESLGDYEGRIDSLALSYSQPQDLSANPNLRSMDLGLRQLEAGFRAKRMEYYPTLGLSFNYAYAYASDYFRLSNSRRWTPTSSIGLVLNVPLYSGGSTRYGLKSMRIQQEVLEVQREELKQQLQLQSTSQRDALRNATAQYRASREAEQGAKRGLEIATVRYKTGNGTLLELNDSELALRQSQLNLAQAVYNYMVAVYAIDELEGR
ncbi:MAG: TolC family protein [Porphyromonas sp.]|nr:TolC family protein [Porphyromonas sp.]